MITKVVGGCLDVCLGGQWLSRRSMIDKGGLLRWSLLVKVVGGCSSKVGTAKVVGGCQHGC